MQRFTHCSYLYYEEIISLAYSLQLATSRKHNTYKIKDLFLSLMRFFVVVNKKEKTTTIRQNSLSNLNLSFQSHSVLFPDMVSEVTF